MTGGRLVRLAESARAPVEFIFDGEALTGLEGDTVLTAILLSRRALRDAEFGPEARAGFCLMGACQDCWVWQEGGARLRACSTPLREGMRLRSAPGGTQWPGPPADAERDRSGDSA
ncbi:(2Fe-2S)-binding protein [Marinibacterium profundimaris]|uniref:(2Fe-2S)-binding protein n=1 Tax=Marinibacterium profundimaris TaxID=1679460 RepID=UPI000B51FBA4|nr:(2Fe-2S)-binding protein [Marinibacterium profundimaris]